MAEDAPAGRTSPRRALLLVLAVVASAVVACGSGGAEEAETTDTTAPTTSEQRDNRVTFEYDDSAFGDGTSTTDRDRPDRSSSSTSSTRPDQRPSTTSRPADPNRPTQTTQTTRLNQPATTARPQPTTTRPRATTTTRPRTTTTVSSLPRCGQHYHVVGLTTAVCRDADGQPYKSGLPNSGSFTCASLEANGMTAVHLIAPYTDPFDLDGNDTDHEGCNE